MNLFHNRPLVIATKHGKERVISPILIEHLGVLPFTTDYLDTDLLGTFTGEIERKLSPVEAARKKCLLACQLNGCDLAVASEGSFLPHPQIGFIPIDHEILYLYDKKNELEIHVSEISTKTNFSSDKINSLDELKEFARKVNFPSHHLILKTKDRKIVKGIKDWQTLEKEFVLLYGFSNEVTVETDMRAMANPTRMQVIALTAKKLVDVANSLCPSCKWPGFSVIEHNQGLPCSNCNLPTRSTLSHLYKCNKCTATKIKMYPNSKMLEDPTFCDYCNP